MTLPLPAGSTSFTYDAEGRRMSRTAGGVTTAFLYDGSEVLLERQGTTTTATYTYGNALVRKDGETPLFDGLGSERTVTNTAGAVQGTLTTTAFGQPVASIGSSTDPYGFAATSGYRNDGDAGLMLVGARYYDAQIGMFISRDTDLSQLPYGYCDGDPVNAVDPDGHAPKGIKKALSPDGNGGGITFGYGGGSTTTTTRGGSYYTDGKHTQYNPPTTTTTTKSPSWHFGISLPWWLPILF